MSKVESDGMTGDEYLEGIMARRGDHVRAELRERDDRINRALARIEQELHEVDPFGGGESALNNVAAILRGEKR